GVCGVMGGGDGGGAAGAARRRAAGGGGAECGGVVGGVSGDLRGGLCAAGQSRDDARSDGGRAPRPRAADNTGAADTDGGGEGDVLLPGGGRRTHPDRERKD